jgi:hypothetical protein
MMSTTAGVSSDGVKEKLVLKRRVVRVEKRKRMNARVRER